MKSLIITFYLMIGLAAVLVAGLGLYAERTITRLSNRTAQVLRENYDSVAYMDTMLQVLAAQDRKMLERFIPVANIEGVQDVNSTAPLEASLHESNAALEDCFRRAKGNITLPGEAEAIGHLGRALSNYQKAVAEFLSSFSQMKSASASQLPQRYENTVRPESTRAVRAAEAVRKINQDWMELTARRQIAIAPRLLIVGTTIALVLLFGFGIQLGRRLQRQLYELQALRSHFIAIASHELRTPLTSLRMGLDLLAKETVGPLTVEQLTIAKANLEDCDRLLALARQLLDVTKIHAGPLDVRKTSVRLTALVAEAVSALRSQMQEKMVTIDLDLQSTNDVEVQADAVKAIWVITNLLSNALRYSSQGGTIRISANIRGQEVHLSVSDYGPGIPPESAQSVFKPYYQESASAIGKPRGAVGLGLAIAQEIVAAHGGRIWVEAKPFLNTGTTITFTLPKAKED